MNVACPSDLELERLLVDQLGPAEEQALEAHVSGCDACQRRLDELTHGRRTIRVHIPSENGNGEPLPLRGGVLARLGNSSRPPHRLVELDGRENTPGPHSSRRWFDGSATMRASGRFLRRQFWTWPLIAAALLGLAGWWVNRSVEDAMRHQRINELTTVLEADIAALGGWMDNQRATAELVAADEQLEPLVRELVALLDGNPEVRNRLVRAPAQAAIRSRLERPLRRGGFIGFVLISPSGIAVAVDENAPVGAAMSDYRQDFFRRVVAGEAAVSRPFLSPLLLPDTKGELRAGQPCMYAAAPVRDHAGQPIAALGLRIRPDDQFTQILQVAQSGKSGETYAFDRGGLLLSQSRFDKELKQIGLLIDRSDSRSILAAGTARPGGEHG